MVFFRALRFTETGLGLGRFLGSMAQQAVQVGPVPFANSIKPQPVVSVVSSKYP